MSNLRRWWRRRNARRLALAMRDALVPSRPRPRLTVTPRAARPRPGASALNDSDSRSWPRPAPSASRASSPKMRRASGVHAGSPPRQSSAKAAAQLLVALGRVEDPPDDELGRDRAVPVVLLQPERDVEQAGREQPVELRALTERDRAPGVASVLTHAEAKMLPLSDGRGVTASVAGTSRVTSGLPRPNGASRSSSSARSSVRSRRRDDRIHGHRLEEVARGRGWRRRAPRTSSANAAMFASSIDSPAAAR